MGRSCMHNNICARLSASVNQAARLQLPEQPVGALLCERAARLSVDSSLPLPYGRERSDSRRALRCTPRQSSRGRPSAAAPAPCLHPGALPQSPLITSKRSLCFLFWFPSVCLSQAPLSPPFLFLPPANRTAAKNSSVGLLRIYICK